MRIGKEIQVRKRPLRSKRGKESVKEQLLGDSSPSSVKKQLLREKTVEYMYDIIVVYGYIEGFTADYLISFGDTLFRFLQPHIIFHQPKTLTSSYPFYQSDLYPSPSS